jgi:uncharacterized protein (TIGR02328 family)
MRLWHQKLIPYLPRQQLLGQHREICALRGNGWCKKHSTIDYIKQYGLGRLWQYHTIVISEMTKRGYKADTAWQHTHYRGKNMPYLRDLLLFTLNIDNIYPEHNDQYLQECLNNLKCKGIDLASMVEENFTTLL